MEYAVEVSNLTKRFGDFTAVDGISFAVKKGEIFGFLGPNGAGKSTTIRMLTGILIPTEGSGRVSGFDIITGQDSIKKSIGYMSQRFSLYDDLTARENLNFFGSIYGLDGAALVERIDHVIVMAGIAGMADRQVKNLPAGIKQRLALGAAIIHDPPILFLDEPTSGVDPVMRRNFWDLIYRFSREGKTIFVTSHYMDEVENCSRIILIISGRIIAMDSPDNLKSSFPYEVYSLNVEHLIKIFDHISRFPFVQEAAVFGSDIHILTEKGYPLEKEIKKIFKRIGVKKFRLERVPPTLEDVFVVNARKFGG